MYNPLLPDISKVKDNELETKINELSKKYFIAAKMGHGAICEQINHAIDLYKQELQKRHYDNIQKVIKKQDRNFDDLINVE